MKVQDYIKRLFYDSEIVEKDPEWEVIKSQDNIRTTYLTMLWNSRVPYSNAPESLVASSIQSLENQGFDMARREKLFKEGLKALEEKDVKKLELFTPKIFSTNYLRRIKNHPYLKFSRPSSFEEVSKDFPIISKEKIKSRERVYGGLLGSIIGGAYGTPIEGYTYWQLEKRYDKFDYYLRPVNTINDDICFQIVFLLKYLKKGDKITSRDVAYGWLKYIPFGWSAELIALENLRRGIFPPQSATLNNPFGEWIGAAMRGTMPGLISAGDPNKAVRLAYTDATVSHYLNGVYGEMFISALTSLAFICNNIEEIINTGKKFVPHNTELYSVIDEILSEINRDRNFFRLRDYIYRRFQDYNWIHLYPNIAVVLVSLLLGKEDFQKTLEMIGKSGFDVDCNGGMALSILGVLNPESIPQALIKPITNKINTYLRGMEEIQVDYLVDEIMKAQ